MNTNTMTLNTQESFLSKAKAFIKEHKYLIILASLVIMAAYILTVRSGFAAGIINSGASKKANDLMIEVVSFFGKLMAIVGAILAAIGIASGFAAINNGQQLQSQLYQFVGGVALVVLGLSLPTIVKYFMS